MRAVALELRQRLERRALELEYMARFDPDRSKFSKSAVPRLLATAERYLDAMSATSTGQAAAT